MTVADVRKAWSGPAYPGTRRFWWVVAEIISLAEEGVSRVRYELDHWANLAMAKSEQFEGRGDALTDGAESGVTSVQNDPKAGDGTFLRQAVEHLEQRYGQALS